MNEKTIQVLLAILSSANRAIACNNLERAKAEIKDAKTILTKEAVQIAEEEAQLIADLDALEQTIQFPDELPPGSYKWN